MGNNQSAASNPSYQNLPKSFKDWQFINEAFDSRFGEIKIYQCNFTGETICLVNRAIGQANLPHKIARQIDHLNIVRLHHYEVSDQSQLCSSFQKVTLVYEYLTNDLSRNIQLRSQKQIYYSHRQLWALMSQLLQALIFLQNQNVYHRDLLSSNILITSKGVPKLWDVSLLNNQLPGFQQVALGIREELHLSPEELLAVRENQKQPNINPAKSDIFQLGLSLLEASTLDTVNHLYDTLLYQIDFAQLEYQIQETESRYGQDWASLLRIMLAENLSHRGDFQLILSKIPETMDLDLLAFTEEGKRLGSNQKLPKTQSDSKQSENVWFSTSKHANEIAALPFEELFNTSQNQNQSQEQQQNPPHQHNRRNSRHQLESKEIRFMSRPSSVSDIQHQQHAQSERKQDAKSNSSKPPQPNSSAKENKLEALLSPTTFLPKQNSISKKDPLIPPSQEKSFLNEQLEDLKKQQYEFQQLRVNHSNYNQKCVPTNQNVEIPLPCTYSSNYQSPSSFSQPQYFQQPVLNKDSSYQYPQYIQAVQTVQSPIEKSFEFSCPNIAQPPKVNSNLDQQIEDVLKKSKQALARFNNSISGMPCQQQPSKQPFAKERLPLLNLVKNEQSSFTSPVVKKVLTEQQQPLVAKQQLIN